MKKFVTYSILLSTILLLVFIGIELLLLTRPNTYAYKYDYMEKHIDDIHVLLLGNSHIEEALIPNLMREGTFNLAISGRNRIYDIELAKKFLPRMKNLEVVVMPLDYTNFALGREVPNPNETRKDAGMLTSTYKCMYYKYMGIRVDEPWYWSEIFNSRLNYMSRFWKSDADARECDSLGYIKQLLENRLHDWANRSLPALIDTKKPIDKKKYDLLYGDYCTLADLTRQCGARLILLGTPMYKTYQKSMNKKVEKDILVFVEKLQVKHSNVEYYDFTYESCFESNDFVDASHLTDLGATKFSKIIADVIEGRIDTQRAKSQEGSSEQ